MAFGVEKRIELCWNELTFDVDVEPHLIMKDIKSRPSSIYLPEVEYGLFYPFTVEIGLNPSGKQVDDRVIKFILAHELGHFVDLMDRGWSNWDRDAKSANEYLRNPKRKLSTYAEFPSERIANQYALWMTGLKPDEVLELWR